MLRDMLIVNSNNIIFGVFNMVFNTRFFFKLKYCHMILVKDLTLYQGRSRVVLLK